MTSKRAEKIAAELQGLSPAEQADRLREICGDDDALREAVQALLHRETATREWTPNVDSGLLDAALTAAAASGRATTSRQIGPYTLRDKIGEGGFGVVWLAEQEKPIKRRVALKVIKLGMDTKEVIKRFEQERQSLALMDHPHIAKVLDAGATPEGRPFFVMELVAGVPIDDYCTRHNLDTRARLELFIKVCQAVQHAHQKGIIHRDLKPGNVLVEEHDGEASPKVIDFGIAKATSAEHAQHTMLTEQQQIVGTPEYMSPEQVSMTSTDIDTRTDIYALGVMLYELLTGTRPFDAKELFEKGFVEMIRVIQEVEPQKPSTRAGTLGPASAKTTQSLGLSDSRALSARLRGDIDWIVMKCLAKERDRRYETANGLAADLLRHLNDEPVSAGPPSAKYRMQKFVKRNRGQVAAAGLVAAALVLGFIGTYVGMVKAQDESERAVKAEKETAHELDRATEIKGLIAKMLRSVSPQEIQHMDTELMKRILADAAKRLDSGEIEDELVVGELSLLVGETYLDIAASHDGDRHIRRAWEIRKRLLGADDPVTLESQNAAAVALAKTGHMGEAVNLFAETLEARRRVLGPEHHDTVESLCWHADASRALRRQDIDANVARAREVVAIARRALQDDDPLLGHAFRVVIKALLDADKFEEASPLVAEAIALYDRTLPETHPLRIEARSMQASIQLDVGQVDDAVRTSRECMAEAERVFGGSHPLAQSSIMQFAEVLVYAGRFSACVGLLDDRVDVDALGEHTTFTEAMTAYMLGTAYVRAGRYAEARDLFSRLREDVPAALWGHSDARLRTAFYLMQAYDGLGAADDEARKIRKICQDGFGAEGGPGLDGHHGGSYFYWAALSFLAPDAPDLHDPERALEFARGGATAEEHMGGNGLWFVLDALAQAQHHNGDHAAAITTQERALSEVPEGADESIRTRYGKQIETYKAAQAAGDDE